MLSVGGEMKAADLKVYIANNGILPAWHWAKLLTRRVIHVALQTHPAIRDQALDLKEEIWSRATYYIGEAVQEGRARDAHLCETHGQPELAALIREDMKATGRSKPDSIDIDFG